MKQVQWHQRLGPSAFGGGRGPGSTPVAGFVAWDDPT